MDVESWTIKKAEHRRVDTFQLWSWRKFLRVPWTAKRSFLIKESQSWIFIGRNDAEAEGPVLWPLDGKNWHLENTLMLGKIEGRRRRGWQRMRWLDGILNSTDMSLSKVQEVVVDRVAWHVAVHGVEKSRTRLSNWTELNLLRWPWNKMGKGSDLPSSSSGLLELGQLLPGEPHWTRWGSLG